MDKSRKVDERDIQLRVCKAELTELRQSLRFVELQFAKSQESCNSLRCALQTSREEGRKALETGEKLREELAAANRAIEEQERGKGELKRKAEEEQHELKDRLEAFMREIHGKDSRIETLEREKSELKEQIRGLEHETEEAAVHLLRLDEELTIRTKELGYLQVKLLESSSQTTLDSLHIQPDSEDPKLAELQQLHTEKQHLLQLIRTSPQLRELSDYSEDSRGMRYLPRPGRCSRKGCPGSGVSWECEDWVPQDVYRLAEDFSLKYQGSIDSTELKELVQSMNISWRNREINRIRRIRKEMTNTIKSLQRQIVLNSASPEDIREIHRLKAQLRELIAARHREEADAIDVTSVAFSQDEEAPSDLEILQRTVEREAEKLLRTIQSAVVDQFQTPQSDTAATIQQSQEWLMVRDMQQQVGNAVESFLAEVARV